MYLHPSDEGLPSPFINELAVLTPWRSCIVPKAENRSTSDRPAIHSVVPVKKSPLLRKKGKERGGSVQWLRGLNSKVKGRGISHVVGRALGTSVEVLAGVLGNPDGLAERGRKVENVLLEVLGLDVVPVENVCIAQPFASVFLLLLVGTRVRRGVRTEVGLGIRADVVEVDQPLLSAGRAVGGGRSEPDTLVSELGKLLAPELTGRGGVDVGLSGTVGPVRRRKRGVRRSVNRG